VLGVKNVERVSGFWVVLFDVAFVLFESELEAATLLAHVHFIARLARKSVDATSVIWRGGWGYSGGFGDT
jgi:hypothetical protein